MSDSSFKKDLLKFGGINATTGNMLLKGNVRANGNGSAFRQLSVAQLLVGNLTVVGNAMIPGISFSTLNVAGNVTSGGNFIGNGALMTGVTSTLPTRANLDIIGNVAAPGNVDVAGQVTAVGNVVANYFIGNGALLTGVATSFTASGQTITTSNLIVATDQYLSIVTANSTALALSVNGVNTGGNLMVLANTGFVSQTNLNGFLMVPQGYVANTQVRLELAGGNAPVGTLVTQVDTGNTYLLTATPSYENSNWIIFTGTNFPVTTVFGRTGDVLAAYGDYPDNYIPLVANVGTTPAGNSIAEALQTLQLTKANIINGNVSATYFLGNGALLTGITTSTLPSTANINIVGNVSANTLFVSDNVVGNLSMASNVRIFSQQMPFMWNPAVFASPIVTGNNIIVATAQGANGTYDGTQNGWRFTNLLNQYSSLAWNTGFDFRRDFRVDTGMYFTAFAGGNWISVGGSTNGGTSTPNTVNNGALTVSINFASGTGITYLNAATLSSNPYHLTASSATWYSLSVVVQTVAGKRFLTAYLNNGPVETSADVTTWVPTGSFLVVGGNTAATTNAQYLNNVRLSYL